ncbi:twin-arginine translocation signal domain-containing protein [Candidatus Nanohalococcus occultus]
MSSAPRGKRYFKNGEILEPSEDAIKNIDRTILEEDIHGNKKETDTSFEKAIVGALGLGGAAAYAKKLSEGEDIDSTRRNFMKASAGAAVAALSAGCTGNAPNEPEGTPTETTTAKTTTEAVGNQTTARTEDPNADLPFDVKVSPKFREDFDEIFEKFDPSLRPKKIGNTPEKMAYFMAEEATKHGNYGEAQNADQKIGVSSNEPFIHFTDHEAATRANAELLQNLHFLDESFPEETVGENLITTSGHAVDGGNLFKISGVAFEDENGEMNYGTNIPTASAVRWVGDLSESDFFTAGGGFAYDSREATQANMRFYEDVTSSYRIPAEDFSYTIVPTRLEGEFEAAILTDKAYKTRSQAMMNGPGVVDFENQTASLLEDEDADYLVIDENSNGDQYIRSRGREAVMEQIPITMGVGEQ